MSLQAVSLSRVDSIQINLMILSKRGVTACSVQTAGTVPPIELAGLKQ